MSTKWPNRMTEKEMAQRIREASKGQFCGYMCAGCGVTRSRFSQRCHKCGTYEKEKIIRPKLIA